MARQYLCRLRPARLAALGRRRTLEESLAQATLLLSSERKSRVSRSAVGT